MFLGALKNLLKETALLSTHNIYSGSEIRLFFRYTLLIKDLVGFLKYLNQYKNFVPLSGTAPKK